MLRLLVWLAGAVYGVMLLEKHGMLRVDAALICSLFVSIWIFGGAFLVRRGFTSGKPSILAEAARNAKQRAAMGKITSADGMKTPQNPTQ